MEKPYTQVTITKNTLIREFKSTIDSEELVWHRDRNDRQIKVVKGSGWLLQMDNNLPESLIEGNTYKIPACKYHRLLKGDNNLVLHITEDFS